MTGLLGYPLGHSRSPLLHACLGDPDYRLFSLPPEEAEAFLRRREFDGLNVTIPYKKLAASLCDWLSPEALQAGAVNTVVREGDRLLGYNTDLLGFRTMAGDRLAGKTVLLLGATGGAAAAVETVCREQGAEVLPVSRSGAVNYENVYDHAEAQVVVNATPVGMYPDSGCPLELSRFPALECVLDLIYNPLRTPLILQAERLGIPAKGGLEMLTAQAACSRALFDHAEMQDPELLYRCADSRLTHLVLVGMPGSGKTTLGRRLARRMGRSFLDCDALLTQRLGMDIPAFFRQQGEAAFREAEKQLIRDISVQSDRGAVISTGGGAVLDAENRARLKSNGFVVQICRPLDKLAVRGRPLSQGNGKSLSEMERVRTPLYADAADASVDNTDSSARTVEQILLAFANRCQYHCK